MVKDLLTQLFKHCLLNLARIIYNNVLLYMLYYYYLYIIMHKTLKEYERGAISITQVLVFGFNWFLSHTGLSLLEIV